MFRFSWTRFAVTLWAVLLAATCFKPLVKPVSGTVYVTYATAGREFAAGNPLYDVMHPFTDNYRYSPLVAAAFVPLSLLPLGVGGMLWRALGAAVFLTGLNAWAKRVCPDVPRAGLFLAALPLSIGSLANGQANVLVIGALLWATALATRNRWALAAVLVAGAGLFKGYPLAFGMLLALAAPVRFGLPLIAAAIAGLALPFAFQSPEYVSGQYELWQVNLGRDDRTNFPLYAGHQDFHMLLRVVGLHIERDPYRIVQALTGLAAAAVVVWQLRRGIERSRVVENAFALGVCWMIVFGPVVESSTFILLAPVLARELFDGRGRSRWAHAFALAGAALFAVSIGVFAFPHAIHRPVIALGIQPLAALCASVAAVGRGLALRPAPVLMVPQPVSHRAAA